MTRSDGEGQKREKRTRWRMANKRKPIIAVTETAVSADIARGLGATIR
jgi:hypothetical protein